MRIRNLIPLAGAAALFAGQASAQISLIQNGDLASNGSTVTAVWRVEVNSNGDWVARVDTDATTDQDECLVWNGAVYHQEGTSQNLSAPALATMTYADSIELDDAGNFYALLQLTLNGGASGRALYRNGVMMMEQGVTPCNALGVPANSVWTSIAEIWVNNGGHMLVGGQVNDGNGALDALVRMTLDGSGNVIAEDLLMMDGMQPAGHNAVVTGFYLTATYNAMNDLGQVIFPVDDSNDTVGGTPNDNICCDSHLYLDSTILFNESDGCNAVPGRLHGHISTYEVDINNNGDWVMNTNLDTTNSADNAVLIKNDSVIVAREGDLLPNVGNGTYHLTSYGIAPVRITPNGDVIWYGDWDDPDTTVDTGIFLNDQLLVQEGNALGGSTISAFDTGSDAFDMSGNGRYVVFIATLANGVEAAWLLTLQDAIGTPYCGPAQNNSTGGPAVIGALGSEVALDNDVVLVAEGMPQAQFGYFLNSMAQGFSPFPNGSQGILCLGGSIGRYVGDIFNTGSNGKGQLTLDLPNTPIPTGTTAIVAGQTWYFQCWFRDTNPSSTSNFTDGIAITFQ